MRLIFGRFTTENYFEPKNGEKALKYSKYINFFNSNHGIHSPDASNDKFIIYISQLQIMPQKKFVELEFPHESDLP